MKLRICLKCGTVYAKIEIGNLMYGIDVIGKKCPNCGNETYSYIDLKEKTNDSLFGL
jgi:predicted  nucleic acid-binding Zn-ribbon protein